MLTVKQEAADYLAEVLESKSPSKDLTIRIVFGFNGLELQPSAECPGDTVYTYQGKTVLVVDENMTRMLADKTLKTRMSKGKRELDLA